MEAGLMELVLSLNRSWIYDTDFSLYRPIYTGRMSGGEMSWWKCPDKTVQKKLFRQNETHRVVKCDIYV